MTTIHLWSLAYGAIGVAVLYTFFPKLAETPSSWLRSFWSWAKGLLGRIRPSADGEG